MTGAGHTAERWKAYKDGVHPVLEDGSNGNESHAICQCFGPDALANARLIVAACNSYDRHFGNCAVEAAEGDLLGKALEALRELADSLEIDCQCPPCEGSDAPAEHWLGVARRILSQAQAREVTR